MNNEQWKEIDTAPLDGTAILLFFKKQDLVIRGFYHYFDGEHCDGYRISPDYYWWCTDNDSYVPDDPEDFPTHWLPIPSTSDIISK